MTNLDVLDGIGFECARVIARKEWLSPGHVCCSWLLRESYQREVIDRHPNPNPKDHRRSD